MDRKVNSILIDCGEPKESSEIAEALRIIADNIDEGSCSGIVGWSDVSWYLLFEYNEEKDIDK